VENGVRNLFLEAAQNKRIVPGAVFLTFFATRIE
jgi:hypothetical protein